MIRKKTGMGLKRILSSLTAVALLTITVAGCAEINYKVDLTSETEQYTINYSVNVQKTELLNALKMLGEPSPEQYVVSYLEDMKQNESFTDNSNDTTISYDIQQTGTILEEEQTSPDTLYVYYKENKEQVLVNIPVHRLIPADVKKIDNLNTVFTKVEITVAFKGQVVSSNIPGDNNIFDKTLTWDTNSVIEAVKKNTPLIAVGNTSEIVNPLILIIAGAFVALLILVIIIIRFVLEGRRAAHNRKLAKEEALRTATDWESDTPEAWALKQISNTVKPPKRLK